MDEIDFPGIAEDVVNGNAILFLGPGATVNYKDPSAQRSFFKDLKTAEPKWVMDYHEEDSFLIFHPKGRDRLGSRIANFYSGEYGNPLLNTLALVPFKVVVGLSPDLAMVQTMERKGLEFNFHYNSGKPATEVGDFSAARPLVYNLFGSAESPSSLVLSNVDFFNYIQTAQVRNSLPAALLDEFVLPSGRSKTLIFFGMEYDKWYFHLLMHLLKFKRELSPYAAGEKAPLAYHLSLFKADFDLKFVEHNPLEFAKTLLENIPEGSRRRPQPQREKMWGFLMNAVEQVEFEALCLVHFGEVYNEFQGEQSRTFRIGLLLKHIEERQLWDRLMQVAQKANDNRFPHYFPDYGK